MSTVNQTNVRLRRTAFRVARHFRNDDNLRWYQATYTYIDDIASNEPSYDKNNFIEFVGTLYSTTPDNLSNIQNSNLYDVASFHKVITADMLEFKIHDRISEGILQNKPKNCYVIVQIDSFIGYTILFLQEMTWD